MNATIKSKSLFIIMLLTAGFAVSVWQGSSFLNNIQIGGLPYQGIMMQRDQIDDLARIRVNLNIINAAIFQMAKDEDADMMDDLAPLFESVDTLLQKISLSLDQPATADSLSCLNCHEREEISELISISSAAHTTWAAYKELLLQKMKPLLAAEDIDAFVEMHEDNFSEIHHQMMGQTKDTIDLLRQGLLSMEESISEDGNRKKIIFSIVGLLFTLSIIGFIAYTLRSIVASIQDTSQAVITLAKGDLTLDKGMDKYLKKQDEIGDLSRAMEAMTTSLDNKSQLTRFIAEGDLTHEVNVLSDKDELGRSLQAMVKKLTDIITSIQNDSKNLTKSSEEMTDITNALAANSEEMNNQSSLVAASTDTISGKANSISETSGKMSSGMESIADSSEILSAGIKETREKGQEGQQTTETAMMRTKEASVAMESLNKAAKQIGEVTGQISEIAEQTKLLALNATIEAARAGESGKGFAVVANEVKDLAKQSAEAVDSIVAKITDIQTQTTFATNVIADVHEIVSRINEASELTVQSVDEQSQMAGSIADNVSTANRNIAEIASSISELADGANDVAANIHGITQAVDENSQSIQQVNSHTVKLTQMAAGLEKLVQEFTVQNR